MQKSSKGDENELNKNARGLGFYLVAVLIILLLVSIFRGGMEATQSWNYREYQEALSEGKVVKVEITPNQEVPTGSLKIVLETGDVKYVNVTDVERVQDELRANGDVEYEVESVERESIFLTTVLPMLMIGIVLVIIFTMMNRQASGGNSRMMNFGKSRARMVTPDAKRVTFKDVAGLQEEKEDLEEIVTFLKEPSKFIQVGARIPKGVILVGPPGTGKTLLAKAVAGEAGVPFFSISGSDFVEMFVGVGASRVRDLFEEAKKNAPCIIFIDEIDAIGKSRDSRYGGGNDEREQTLNQLLAEMDGFDTSKGLLVLAATNRPEVLDQALLRPGRFDRRVIVDKPDLKGRVDVLKVHAKDVHMDETVDLEAIALATSGAVGSDLANMINEAAILAVKEGRAAVSQKDLFASVELVLVGKEKKDRILSEEERRIVSYHEVGHALVSALQKDSEPVQKITIVPRTMGALGYVMNVPEEEKYLNTEKEIRAMLVEFVAGRAAEEIVFDTVTTGAANDIEKATRVARAMVTQYGMSKRFGLMGLEVQANQYLDNRPVMNCSDATAAEVDDEVMKVLKESYEEAKRLLTEHRSSLDRIAEFLIEKETITGKEFMEIFHETEGIVPEESKKSVSRVTERTVQESDAKESMTVGEKAADESAETAGEEDADESAEAAGEAEEAGAETAGETAEENTKSARADSMPAVIELSGPTLADANDETSQDETNE